MVPTTAAVSRVLTVLLDIVFIGLLASILAAVVVGRVVPLLGHPTLVVAGGSMAPAIGVGSAIIVDPVDPADLLVGDVVSLQEAPDRTTYTHRITRIVERDGARWLETKGDANAAVDPAISAATGVIGRVAIVLPLLGFAIALMAQPTGVASVLALAAALVVARTLVSPAPNAGRTAGLEWPDRARSDEARPDGVAASDVIADDGGTKRDGSASARRASRSGPGSARKRAAGASVERAVGARTERRGAARPRAIRATQAG
jgi:signal peptidase